MDWRILLKGEKTFDSKLQDISGPQQIPSNFKALKIRKKIQEAREPCNNS